MLDQIYQKAMTAQEISVYVIFSGDGHFSSVASFLINRCGKMVEIYGIRDAISMQLRNTASNTIEWPPLTGGRVAPLLRRSQKEDAMTRPAAAPLPSAVGMSVPKTKQERPEKRKNAQTKTGESAEKNAVKPDLHPENHRKPNQPEKSSRQNAAGGSGETSSAIPARQGAATERNRRQTKDSQSDGRSEIPAENTKRDRKRSSGSGFVKSESTSIAPETATFQSESASAPKKEKKASGRNNSNGQDRTGEAPRSNAADVRQSREQPNHDSVKNGTDSEKKRKSGVKNGEKQQSARKSPLPSGKQTAEEHDVGRVSSVDPAQKKESAEDCKAKFPTEEDPLGGYYKMLLKNFSWLQSSNRGSLIHKPTYTNTVDTVANCNEANPEMVRMALNRLCDLGYFYLEKERVGLANFVKTVHVNWEKVEADGLWKRSSKE